MSSTPDGREGFLIQGFAAPGVRITIEIETESIEDWADIEEDDDPDEPDEIPPIKTENKIVGLEQCRKINNAG